MPSRGSELTFKYFINFIFIYQSYLFDEILLITNYFQFVNIVWCLIISLLWISIFILKIINYQLIITFDEDFLLKVVSKSY